MRSVDDLPRVSALPAPLVVKPLLEGSSIGIGKRNLVDSAADAVAVAADLLAEFDQPVLAEVFVPGREVSYVKIEDAGPESWALTEVVKDDDSRWFETRLFDADEKFHPNTKRHIETVDAELSKEDQAALDAFLTAFGHYGYCRVDGRLAGGLFNFIEMTPDAWLGPHGQFAAGFISKGWAYRHVGAAILRSASRVPQDR